MAEPTFGRVTVPLVTCTDGEINFRELLANQKKRTNKSEEAHESDLLANQKKRSIAHVDSAIDCTRGPPSTGIYGGSKNDVDYERAPSTAVYESDTESEDVDGEMKAPSTPIYGGSFVEDDEIKAPSTVSYGPSETESVVFDVVDSDVLSTVEDDVGERNAQSETDAPSTVEDDRDKYYRHQLIKCLYANSQYK